ncbi:glycoside hydrolase family 18 protein [Xylariaceae sp. AK1471]|nr:glycoside hydrolase family 18 protein [Xylariaceae sp. AK1471]
MMHPASSTSLPRLILYHQTTHNPDGTSCSILPLITQPGITVTHIIIAAIHINQDPYGLTLNDHPPSDPRFTTTWAELRVAQASGITILGMLGGAAKGTYTRLDRDRTSFELYYEPLYDLVRERGLSGLDLDVEESMSLAGIIRLIDRLRADFGPDFIITLAPVAAALLDARRNLSGFDYEALEVMRGSQIAWYNAQFYCGWGDASNPIMYEMCVARGWAAEKLVVGLVTTPENGAGYVPFEVLHPNFKLLQRQFPKFGGVMGWEYFNGRPGGKERPWEWAQEMTKILRASDTEAQSIAQEPVQKPLAIEVDPDDESEAQPPLPKSFEYHSDSFEEDS